ncbi:hypothetical protein M426DRAFT_7187 [Hypoxylon sp. CI-4A]|nr:hypothetical protein M426DRAFT_7187 [Hypoxylon sp. CI-4A]
MKTIGEYCSRVDDLFGPFIDHHCRGGFDFTLFFEQTVLTAIPAAVFIVASLWRIVDLKKSRPETLLTPARYWKLAASVAWLILQLTLLVFWALAHETRASLPTAIINVIAAILIVVLSWMEDSRAIRPSTILVVFLLVTAILDLAQARTLWLQHLSMPIAAIFTVSIIGKAFMLILENGEKTSYLRLQVDGDLSPESTSGIINRSFLWWMNDLYRKGFRSALTLDDLYPLDKQLASNALSFEIQRAWAQRLKPERRLELPLAAWRALRWHILSAIIPRLFLIAFTFAQPFLITHVLDLLTEPDSEAARDTGYGLMLAAAFIYLGIALSSLHYNHSINRFMTMFRGAGVTLIFNHMLTLPIGQYDDSAVVTLMSTDVDNIVGCLVSLNEIWVQLIEVVIGVVLLSRQLGWVCLVPVFVTVISFFGTAEISRTIGARQKVWIDAVQDRITITASMLAEMRSVKMMGLSSVLSTIVQDQRVRETERMAGARWSIVWKNVVQNLPWALAPSLTFVIYVAQASATGQSSIDVTQAFTSLAIISLLTGPVSKLLSAIPSAAASLGCLDRVQNFLTTSPRIDPRLILPPAGMPTISGFEASFAINAEDISLRPAPTAEPILSNVSFSIPHGTLTMVIGPAGSGKTTLLKAILGEITSEDGGLISVTSTQMALCAQVPWLLNTTIRQAIAGYPEKEFGFDERWYRQCIRACALDLDLDRLPDGDTTLVGSASTVLSGGQKARVALARAVYARTEIFLLDDILSALDTTTQATIMFRLFGEDGLLKRRKVTTVLATHATEYLRYADKVLLVANGRVQDCGKGGETVSRELVDVLGSSSESRTESANELKDKEPDAKSKAAEISEVNEHNDMRNPTKDLDVYRYYLRSVGWPKMAIFVAFVIMDVFSSSFSDIWLKWWAEIEGGQIALYMSIYLGLSVLTSLGTGGYVWSILILISPYTARKLHSVLLGVVMRAPQSFFSTTDSGSILNRFSQDMTIIEGQLPIGVLIAVSNLFSSIAAAVLVTTGSIYMVATLPFLISVIWALQNVYLRTSRQLRLLDLESRSPLFSHFLESVGSLATIRAFGWESRFKARHERLLDQSQRPQYMLYCSQRWLNLVLDLVAGAEAVLVIGLAVGLRRSTSPGLLGVSLNSILTFSGSLSSLVSGWTMLETSLGSISRLMKFEATVKPEDKSGEIYQPPPSWPERGAIEFHGVTVIHGPDTVGIRGVSLQVQPGQKIGICGRTGSGKSSLVATIARLLEIESGVISIDDTDIATVPRETIRQRLISLPQDPLILAGSVRLNVDPEGQATDEQVSAALNLVGLGDVVESRGGILADITANSLSRGQQQLLALARAVVKRQVCGSTILLLDEATSNVDADTDAILQRILRESFAGCTRITVAHRIDTIMDSDLIVVMDSGSIVEAGPPGDLMRKTDGWFAKLVQAKE